MALIPRPRKKDMQLRHVPQRNHQPAQKRQHAFVVAAHEQVFAASSGLKSADLRMIFQMDA